MMKAKIDALLEQLKSGKLENDRALLLMAFINYPKGLTIYDIRNSYTNMMDSTIKARITELLDFGMIEEIGKVKRKVENNKLRSYTLYQYQPEEKTWVINADKRRRALFNNKLKSLKLHYADLMKEYGISI